ncbi:MAG: ABC transporter substrate-binding protein [Nitrospira sp.]|nr:ABC transporter substrate-binding protein [Nitrospira sp.]
MIAYTIRIQERAVARSRSAWLIALVLIPCFYLYAEPALATGPEIAILKSSDLKAYNDAVEGFKATAPGNATYVEYDLRGDFDQGKRLARTIRATDSTLVVAVGLKAALTAKLEIVDIPILYMMILAPAKYHLTAANMAGVLIEVPTDRQLKLIRTFLPTLRKIGVLYNPEKTAAKLKEAESHAAGHEFQLRGFPVAKEKEVPQQLRTLLSHSEALWLIPDSTVLTDESIRFILESAVAKQIPVIGFSPEFTRLGALLSLSIDYGEVGREAGLLAKRILNGEQQLPLKPVSVQRIRITVNQKTARYLDITIPKELDSLIDETY